MSDKDNDKDNDKDDDSQKPDTTNPTMDTSIELHYKGGKKDKD